MWSLDGSTVQPVPHPRADAQPRQWALASLRDQQPPHHCARQFPDDGKTIITRHRWHRWHRWHGPGHKIQPRTQSGTQTSIWTLDSTWFPAISLVVWPQHVPTQMTLGTSVITSNHEQALAINCHTSSALQPSSTIFRLQLSYCTVRACKFITWWRLRASAFCRRRFSSPSLATNFSPGWVVPWGRDGPSLPNSGDCASKWGENCDDLRVLSVSKVTRRKGELKSCVSGRHWGCASVCTAASRASREAPSKVLKDSVCTVCTVCIVCNASLLTLTDRSLERSSLEGWGMRTGLWQFTSSSQLRGISKDMGSLGAWSTSRSELRKLSDLHATVPAAKLIGGAPLGAGRGRANDWSLFSRSPWPACRISERGPSSFSSGGLLDARARSGLAQGFQAGTRISAERISAEQSTGRIGDFINSSWVPYVPCSLVAEINKPVACVLVASQLVPNAWRVVLCGPGEKWNLKCPAPLEAPPVMGSPGNRGVEAPRDGTALTALMPPSAPRVAWNAPRGSRLRRSDAKLMLLMEPSESFSGWDSMGTVPYLASKLLMYSSNRPVGLDFGSWLWFAINHTGHRKKKKISIPQLERGKNAAAQAHSVQTTDHPLNASVNRSMPKIRAGDPESRWTYCWTLQWVYAHAATAHAVHALFVHHPYTWSQASVFVLDLKNFEQLNTVQHRQGETVWNMGRASNLGSGINHSPTWPWPTSRLRHSLGPNSNRSRRHMRWPGILKLSFHLQWLAAPSWPSWVELIGIGDLVPSAVFLQPSEARWSGAVGFEICWHQRSVKTRTSLYPLKSPCRQRQTLSHAGSASQQ